MQTTYCFTAMLLINAKLLLCNLPYQNDRVKVTMFKGPDIYLIGGLIVLFTDLFLEQGRCVACMFLKEAIEIGIIFKVEPACYFLY